MAAPVATDTAPVATPVEDTKSADNASDNGKSEKIKRKGYPGLYDADGNRFKDSNTGKPLLLKAWPTDHKSSLHHPLAQNHFENETIFLDHKIAIHEDAIKKLRDERELVTKYANADERKAVMKTRSTFNMLKTLVAQLKESGQDPAELGIDMKELGL